jgi:hypothetical protein
VQLDPASRASCTLPPMGKGNVKLALAAGASFTLTGVGGVTSQI